MSKDGRIWLSHTGLESATRCPQCFWLQINKGIYQPEGIVSRLANRFDIILKKYFDLFRESGELPPMIDGNIEHVKLQNPFEEKYWVRLDEKYGFWGKLDECLVNELGEYIPLDFKTSSSDPRERETLSAYRTQMDDYVFLLKKNRKKVAGHGYLLYVYPDEGDKLHEGFPMITKLEKLDANPDNTTEMISKAIEIIEGQMPEGSLECPFCNYRIAAKEIDNKG